MKKWSNKKAEWLLVMLAVSLTASASWTITAEEKSETIDRYIIVELETLTVPNVDAEEMELSSESEQSTEETGEDRKSTRLNSSHNNQSRMPSSA